MPQPSGHLLTADDRGGEDRVGGGEDRCDEQRLRQRQPGNQHRQSGGHEERQRHPDQQRPARQPPGGSQIPQPHPLPVGEKHGEQRELGEHRDQFVLGPQIHHPEHAVAEQEPGQQEEHRG